MQRFCTTAHPIEADEMTTHNWQQAIYYVYTVSTKRPTG